MKNLNTFKILFILALFLPVFSLKAQYTVKQVLVASGGIYGNPGNKVGMGSYDPATRKLTSFDSIPGNSVTQILMDTGEIAYVATDSTLVKYDFNTLKPLKSMVAYSLRYMALYNQYICVTIGEDGNFNHFKLFRKSDLSLVYQEKNIPGFSEGITVVGDTAYVAVQGTYPYDTGRVAIIDLVNHKLKRMMNLGTKAKGIGQMFYNGTYVLGTSELYGNDTVGVTVIDPKTGAAVVSSVVKFSGAFNLAGDSMYAMLKGGFGSYNLKTTKSNIIIKTPPAIYAAAYDTAGKLFYFPGTDFGKPSMSYVYNYKGKAVDSFMVGPSSQAIAIDYMKKKSGIKGSVQFGDFVQLYPNPAKTNLYISGVNSKTAEITVMDMAGKMLYKAGKTLSAGQLISVPVETLSDGLYIINIRSDEGSVSAKFIKN